ncbi:hypothetical protein V5799_032491 [Amblyomma americanum]|uniref:GH18 domain-containing protein n=1 Tax=Amblyomma americanum TaxID=6943 RepID=A0AAQ4DR06_AMBAM
MRDPMYFENYGEPLDFEVADKGEKVLVPNYMVNLLSVITVLTTIAVVVRVGVASFRDSHSAKGHVGPYIAAPPPPLSLLPEAQEPLEGWSNEEWRALMPSPRPIVCFLNRDGFLRPPPDTLVLRSFPGFYCNEIVYNGLAFENSTLNLLADETDDAIILQLNRVRDALFPHWKVILNIFVDAATAKRMQESDLFLESIFGWLEERRVDGLSFEFDDDTFLGDPDGATKVVAFFTAAKADHRWTNLTLSAMLPYGPTVLFREELSAVLDRIFIKTHGLLDERSGTTQLAAPLDNAGLIHRHSNHHTVMSLLEEMEDNLNKKTCFTLSLSGTAFTLLSPSQKNVGDPVKQVPLEKTSFSDVCGVGAGRVRKIEDDTAYSVEGNMWVTHEDQFTIFEKTAKVLRHWHFLCVAVVDVDLDDVRGECGRVYPLLRRIYETSYILKYS